MKFTYMSKDVPLTERFKTQIEKKFTRLDKYFHKEPEADVKIDKIKRNMLLEVTIWHKGIIFRAEEMDEDLFTCIDKTLDVIDRQIRKNRTKLTDKLHKNATKMILEEYEEDIDEADEFQVIRSKKIESKPMSVEEAILQMNLLGHTFFMFINADTEETNVVYKRKNGDYGLLEPA